MRAYPEEYLDDIVTAQGSLFEYALDFCPGMDVESFINAYMRSELRARIDKADPYVCSKSDHALWEYFCRHEGFSPTPGEHFGGFMPCWIGEFYVYFQWYYNIPSAEVVELIPTARMERMYMGMQDLDMEYAVQKAGKQLGLDV